jgi:hypothetical protein
MNDIMAGMITGDIKPEDALAIVTGITIAAIKQRKNE